MSTTPTNSRLIKYLNMSFDDFVKDIKDFSKIYFPKNSKDLSEGSSAQMMIEQASFVGDVLSFYLEDRFRNTNNITANDITQIIKNAKSLGYKFTGPSAASGLNNFYLEVPATSSAGVYSPDMRYAMNMKNVQLQNQNGVVFEATDDVNFSLVNTSSNLSSVISRTNIDGTPNHFILKSQVEVIGAKTVVETQTIGDFQAFREIQISQPNVVDILSVVDSNGDSWYEVDYLADDSIFQISKNTNSDNSLVPYILKLVTVPRRFVRYVDPLSGKTSIIFGNGKAIDVGNPIVPDPSDLAIDLKGKLTFSSPFIDPQNFIKSRTLGLSPYNTTLTITVRTGGGRITNSAINTLNDITSKVVDFSSSGLSANEINNTLNSFSARNTDLISGGDEAETIDEIKQNSSAFFATQGRLAIREDYISRVLSMPSNLGNVFRVYAVTNSNPNGGVQLYILTKDTSGNLSTASASLKNNVKNYLSKVTRLGQSIDILDGKIIDIYIEYSIVVVPGYNKSKVKTDTLLKIKNLFNNSNWQLNQPIVIDDIRVLIKETDGVYSIANFKIGNRNNIVNGNTYSQTVYDIDSNTKNGIIFSLPNAMFELKYPDGSDLLVSAL